MRVLIRAAVLAALIVLGVVQGVATVALRATAQPGAWVTIVPRPLAHAIDVLDPAVPLPPALRLVFARAALGAHDPSRAAAETARLGPSRDRYALEARIAEARHDSAGAVAAYLAAGDLAGLEAQVDDLAARGEFAEALALQHETIARLRADRTQPDALAEASFRLGRLEERQAYAFAVGRPERRLHERRALSAYAFAVKLAPLSQQYLLAYGNQQLNVAELPAAVRTFERARDADPTSADPWVGLGDAAARRGDRVAARAFLARARAIAPASEAVLRLARELGT
ncbi:MAG: hypothetical protein NVSMB19_03210 [Vulcanimicrobiaceae bacterium]